MTTRLVAAGLNHKTAPVEVREKAAIPGRRLATVLRDLLAGEGLDEVVVLSTCNRTEVYAAAREAGPEGSRFSPAGLLARLAGEEVSRHVYVHWDLDAVTHLFRVACGLDSMVLGESEILGQVKAAYESACRAGTVGPATHVLFQGALRVGARARTETNIGLSAVSVPYVALGLARKVFARLEGKRALLIGTGEIGRVALRHLVEAGLGEIVAANRTLERAEEALASLDLSSPPDRNGTRVACRAVSLDAIREVLPGIDIVIACSEAPHYVVGPGEVSPAMAARRGRPLLLIDLGVPRQIDPALAARGDVYLFNLDDLQNVAQANLEERRREAAKVERIVVEEVERFDDWRRRQRAVPVIQRLRARAEEIRAEELQRLLDGLESASPRDRELVAAFSQRLTNRILDYPTVTLRELAAAPDGTAAIDVFGRILHGRLAVRREAGRLTRQVGTSGAAAAPDDAAVPAVPSVPAAPSGPAAPKAGAKRSDGPC